MKPIFHNRRTFWPCSIRHSHHLCLPEWDGGVEEDVTARLPLQVVTAWHGVEVVTLHVVGLHAPLHGQDGGQGPDVRGQRSARLLPESRRD